MDVRARARAMLAEAYAHFLVDHCLVTNGNMRALPDNLAAHIDTTEEKAATAARKGNKADASREMEIANLLREAATHLPITSKRLMDTLKRTPPLSQLADPLDETVTI